MFTVEIRINGTLITHIYGHNEGLGDGGAKYKYQKITFDNYTGGYGMSEGEVTHRRDDGLNELIRKILGDK